jgi:hypothetical protein
MKKKNTLQFGEKSKKKKRGKNETDHFYFYKLQTPTFFFVVLGLELRAFTLNHSTSLFLC